MKISKAARNQIKGEVERVVNRHYEQYLAKNEIKEFLKETDTIINLTAERFFSFGSDNIGESGGNKGNNRKILGEEFSLGNLSKDDKISFLRLDIKKLIYVRLRLYYSLVAKIDCSNKKIKSLRSRNINEELKEAGNDSTRIFSYLLSLKDEEFLLSKEIIVSFYDVLEECYRGINGVNEGWLIDKLFLLSSLSVTEVDSELMGFSCAILNNVDFDVNKDYLGVRFNNIITDEIIINKTLILYRDFINDIKDPITIELFFEIQKKRILTFLENNILKNDTFKAKIELEFLLPVFLFFEDNEKDYINAIKSRLDIIVESGLIVKDYKIKNDKFIFYFYPLQEPEINEYLK